MANTSFRLLTLAGFSPDVTIAQIVSVDPKAAYFLESIGLRLSVCDDVVTLRSVCRERQWNEQKVLQWVKTSCLSVNGNSGEGKPPHQPDFRQNIPELCSYLEHKFHKRNLELLRKITSEFSRVHRQYNTRYVWVMTYQRYIEAITEELHLYTSFESKSFFPLVCSLNGPAETVLDGVIQKAKKGLEIISKGQIEILRLISILGVKNHQFEKYGELLSTFRNLNHELASLRLLLKKQFEMERDTIIPLIKQKIGDA